MEANPDPRERALALLRAHHTFPGPFEFRVVIRPEGRPAVVAAVAAALGDGARLTDVSERSSSHGKYVSVRLTAQVDDPALVLEVYDVLRSVEGVLTVL